MTASSLAQFLPQFVRRHPFWLVRFLFVYAGNPTVFLLYVLAVVAVGGDDATSEGATTTLFGLHPFREGAAGPVTAYTMNLFLYVLFTLPLYGVWFGAQVRLVVPLFCRMLGSSRTLNLDKFCHNHCSACSCVLAIPGALNLLLTSTIGMGGDVMGFIVTPILIVVALLYIVTWFVGVNSALEYQQVATLEEDSDIGTNNNWCDDGTGDGGIACTSLA